MLITHDLSVIAETVEGYGDAAGKIMESADVVSVFRAPLHPYTSGLWGPCRLNEDCERLHVSEWFQPFQHAHWV